MSSQDKSGNEGMLMQPSSGNSAVSSVPAQAEKTATQASGLDKAGVALPVSSPGMSKTDLAEKGSVQCSNCGHPMDGPFCGQCGQHEKSMIRFFGSVIMHFLDDIFGWDSRAGRTMVPLMFRPGFLTNEYFSGRRVHYVPPLRMYFIVSIIFFLALELFTDDSVKDLSTFQQHNGSDIVLLNQKIDNLQDKMTAPGYVLQAKDQQQLTELTDKRDNALSAIRDNITDLQQQIDEINQKRSKPGYQEQPEDEIQLATFETSIALMKMSLEQVPLEQQIAEVEQQLRLHEELQKQADFVIDEEYQARLDGLEKHRKKLLDQQRQLARAAEGKSDKSDDAGQEKKVGIEVVDSEPQVHVNFGSGFDFLSDEQNRQLQKLGQEMEKKAKLAFSQDAGPLVQQILSVLPQVMFVLLPIFALLLKFVYIFFGRYYMEHLTVALHSHAFIFVNLLCLALLSTLYDVLAGAYETLAEWVELLLIGFALWSPIYLFLMQKRVYKQGVIMTSLKFMLVGFCYVMLLSFSVAIAAFWGLYKL